MRPILEARIDTQRFKFNNFSTPFEFSCSVFRSIAFKNQICVLKIQNFLNPFISDLSISRAAEKDVITIRAGYRIDGKNLLAPLCNGRVIYYKQAGYDFEIHFVEGAVNSLYADEWLTSYYPLSAPMQASWPVILQAIYPKISGIDLVGSDIGTVGNESIYDILVQFSDSTGLMWYFSNEILNIVDINKSTKKIGVQALQKNGGGQLQTTNPWLILNGMSPLAKINRVWTVSCVFAPNLKPGVTVEFLDNLGNTRSGYIGTIRSTIDTASTTSVLSVIEVIS